MRRKIPATHTLLCFEAAARHESYTRAAQELSLTQSAVSRLLIEAELARSDLVVACNQPLKSGHSYWLVMPEQGDDKPALTWFASGCT